MKLKDLIKDIDKKVYNFKNIDIKGIAFDSRKVRDGYIFVALKGEKEDGHKFIPEAIERGAKCIVVEKKTSFLISDVVEIVVDDTKKVLAIISSRFYNDPSSKLKIVGITGTNGKTTTSFLIKNILEKAGEKAGLIGTISYQIGQRQIISFNTTPESADLQAFFSEMLKEECKWAVLEISSHGIEQRRILGINFDCGIFTNITPFEHLDYHKTFKNYLQTKLKFFSIYLKESKKENKKAIINLDDKFSSYFLREAKKAKIESIITYGKHRKSDIKLIDYSLTRNGNKIIFQRYGEKIEVFTHLRGIGNVYNCLAAISFATGYNIDKEIIIKGIEETLSVPGRFEFIDEGQPFDIIVDYAHTHNALLTLLQSVRQMKPKRIILVFGCGGNRDKSKRPLMGKIGVKLSDIVILTSDNPRSEEPREIIKDIEKGIPFYLKKKYAVIIDRKQAIKEAISLAGENDCVVIAGKGHETFQILKDVTVPFDDREEAKKTVKELYGKN
ncbi:MAG TPA: UDP-N-acetylmuramoyl-L-alanyl-D-glutamate--2,6-diaminopimelate ligase [bacterium]|nr:UDP-N-acetylmuramoyl-L-alanyl-D-glutamate--2,6-diaminopimelate ligase [bacterium]